MTNHLPRVCDDLCMLRLVLPKGSLERATMQLFADADLAVSRTSDVAYRATIDDPRIDDVRILRPQEIPAYVAEGLFDLGITGRDCVEERGSDVVSLGELAYSKATSNPARVVLAVSSDSPVRSLAELAALPGTLRISTEYPELTRKILAGHGIAADISFSYGATEAKVPEIADAVVDMTETGSALRAAGLRIIETLLVSYTELIANPAAAADPAKRHAMEQIMTLLQGHARSPRQGPGQAQRVCGPARWRPLGPAVDAGAHDLGALGRRSIRARSRRGEVGHQHPHPGVARQGCDGHSGDPALQDRALSTATTLAGPVPSDRPFFGRVTSFDARRGLGSVTDSEGASIRLPRHRHP